MAKHISKEKILDFIRSAKAPVSKRDVARAFHLRGSGPRVEMKRLLKTLVDEGSLDKIGGDYTMPEGLPAVCVLEVIDNDIDGDIYASPVEWDEESQGPAPRVVIVPDKKGHAPMGKSDRALCRLQRLDDKSYEGRIIKQLDHVQNQIMGLLRIHKSGYGHLQPADKKNRDEFEIHSDDLNGAQDGDLVIAELQPARGKVRRKKARIVDILGKQDDPKAISIISLNEVGLREDFPEKVEDATQGLSVPPLKNREDLRKIPLVTIDGADARDFDDAVWAERSEDGYHILVAIADVSHYVRPDSVLDMEAVKRGNSTYFPDRVVPMLPEALSNDLCSLRPREDRACLAAHLWIDDQGQLKKYKFVRGLMRSEARLIYEEVQDGYDAQKHEQLDLINPLYDAYKILDAARIKRGALDLDLPERQILIDEKGNMTGVKKRQRLDAHKMIEEFMILANVAAAKALEDKNASCVYRVHEPPSLEKLDSAREFIESFDLSLPKGQSIQAKQINQILTQAKKLPYSHLISTVILRTQSQAVYSPNNKGHFGLALSKYGHFTSPIRRYADLLVHRSLIKAYKLGEGGLDDAQDNQLEEICDHISKTERTSMEAERNATDRFTAAYLSDQIGAEFPGRITGVTRFGLFVELDETGADGIVPMRSLPDDYYIHDERAHALIGKHKGRIFQLGAQVNVRLKEANGLTGSTVLQLVGHNDGATVPGVEVKRSYSGSSHGDKRSKNASGKKRHRDGHGGKFKPSNAKKKKKTTPKHKKRQNNKNSAHNKDQKKH